MFVQVHHEYGDTYIAYCYDSEYQAWIHIYLYIDKFPFNKGLTVLKYIHSKSTTLL
jgi:hypothetical protein